MEIVSKDLDKISKEELRKLREKLGVHEFIKLLQSYSEGKGDYTEERRKKLKDLKEEDLEDFLSEELN